LQSTVCSAVDKLAKLSSCTPVSAGKCIEEEVLKNRRLVEAIASHLKLLCGGCSIRKLDARGVEAIGLQDAKCVGVDWAARATLLYLLASIYFHFYPRLRRLTSLVSYYFARLYAQYGAPQCLVEASKLWAYWVTDLYEDRNLVKTVCSRGEDYASIYTVVKNVIDALSALYEHALAARRTNVLHNLIRQLRKRLEELPCSLPGVDCSLDSGVVLLPTTRGGIECKVNLAYMRKKAIKIERELYDKVLVPTLEARMRRLEILVTRAAKLPTLAERVLQAWKTLEEKEGDVIEYSIVIAMMADGYMPVDYRQVRLGTGVAEIDFAGYKAKTRELTVVESKKTLKYRSLPKVIEKLVAAASELYTRTNPRPERIIVRIAYAACSGQEHAKQNQEKTKSLLKKAAEELALASLAAGSLAASFPIHLGFGGYLLYQLLDPPIGVFNVSSGAPSLVEAGVHGSAGVPCIANPVPKLFHHFTLVLP
jgi:hypothetical protein